MAMKRSGLGCLILCAALQGCVATYAPALGEPTAQVRVVGWGRTQICRAGELNWVPTTEGSKDMVTVPAGRRLTIGSHLSDAGYQVIHYCRPFMSFVPDAGKTYVLNSALEGQGRCVVELVREEPSRDNGLSVETSVGPPDCAKR